MAKDQKVKLPPYVSRKRNRYVLRQYIKVSQRGNIQTDKSGYATPIALGHVDDPIHKIYAAYAAVMEQYKFIADEQFLSLRWLCKQYMASSMFINLEPSTQKRYVGCMVILDHPVKIDGVSATFGDCRADEVTRVQIRRILDKRFLNYQLAEKKGGAQCNQERALISAMYRYGGQYVDELAEIVNPTHGISKFKVDIRERYVTDADYQKQYEFAQQHSPVYLPIVMELTYLLAARGVEVHQLQIKHADKDGIKVIRRKGSKTTIVTWSDRLYKAWMDAYALHESRPRPEDKLILSTLGTPIAQSSIDDAWNNLKQLMERRGLGKVYFQQHDLKRKGISDAKDDRIAGQSEAMRRRYNVKHQKYEPPA